MSLPTDSLFPHTAPEGENAPRKRRSSLVYGHSRPHVVTGNIPRTSISSINTVPSRRERIIGIRKISIPGHASYGAITELDTDNMSTISMPQMRFYGHSHDEVYEDHNNRWWNEFALLIRYGIPVVLTSLLQYGEVITTVFSLGHIGKTELAAASLANMTATITAFAIFQGIVSSLDTLGTQSYGSGNPELVGLHLQRILCLLAVVQIPIVIIWWNIKDILIFVGQDPLTALYAGKYMRVLLFASPAYAIFEALKRFLQVQGIFQPVTVILACIVPINVFLNYLLVWSKTFGFGFLGAPVAVCVTLWMACGAVFLYIVKVDGREAWCGFTMEAFKNWLPTCRLAASGIVMICSEYWAFELLTFVAGILGTTELATMSILSTTSSLSYQLAFGIAAAAATRVGNLIGAGNVRLSKLSTQVALTIAFAVGVINCVVLLLLRNKWGYLFNSEPDVVSLVAQVIPLTAIMNIGDNTQCVAGGLLRGQGRQRIGGIVNFIAYYAFSLPLSAFLCFKAGYGIAGLWLSIAIATGAIAIIECYFVFKIDWQALIDDAGRQIEEAERAMEEDAA
ncbi:MatE family transporter [Schizosaccharomyces japonicus yFS275]|uniref:MatE family transporter n=1 Tax=Schizosaccharomyces japonicus (strain yFS275 / FY16936) TaxID=402676 RepID=B6JZV5_SCHJY|nr:MatE family transporter [Schizosaccharomyces japonicus yFS275]EEB06105.1 MatE family transporter [Schizosaccharomyces japonicus yFS275]